MDTQVQRRRAAWGGTLPFRFWLILVLSLSRFPVRFSRKAAEHGPHPKPCGASERFTSDFSGRSVVPYSLLPFCNARVVGVNWACGFSLDTRGKWWILPNHLVTWVGEADADQTMKPGGEMTHLRLQSRMVGLRKVGCPTHTWDTA